MPVSKSQTIDKLDFILAGAQKCGTTALHSFLEKHPEIALPDQQEMHFFDNEDIFAGKEISYEKLHQSFKPGRKVTIAGENTPAYLYWKPAIERIWNYNQAIKLIVILRNPTERAFSHWNMQRDRGYESLDFLEAVRAEPERLRDALPMQSRRFSYIDRGIYSEQLANVFRFFPREQVHVIKFEDFKSHQPETMKAVFGFLGVDPLPGLRNKQRNLIPYLRPMSADEKRQVSEMFQEEVIKLEKLLGWDCSDWKMA